MPKALLVELLEALGLFLVAVGLALWTLPGGLVAAGAFIWLEAQSLGVRPSSLSAERAGLRR